MSRQQAKRLLWSAEPIELDCDQATESEVLKSYPSFLNGPRNRLTMTWLHG